jgi:hypothetical protein
MIKSLSIAALIVATATSSFAGSFDGAAADNVVVVYDVPVIPVVGSGIGMPLIVGGVVAAAVVAAIVDNNDDESSTTTTTTTSN